MIEDLGRRRLSGEISVNPYEMKGNTACTWCGYRSICGFDERMNGCSYRKLRQLKTDDEIFTAMETVMEKKEADDEPEHKEVH